MKPLMTLGALLGTCLFVSAQDAPPRPERPQRQLPPELIKEYDKDGDGKLSDDERTAMRDAMRARGEAQRKATLEKYDADKDGKLSKEEAEKARTERQAEMLKKYDKDADGKLSVEERRAIPYSERGFGGPGGPGGRRGGRGGEGGAPGQDGKPGGDAKPTEKPADAPEKPAEPTEKPADKPAEAPKAE